MHNASHLLRYFQLTSEVRIGFHHDLRPEGVLLLPDRTGRVILGTRVLLMPRVDSWSFYIYKVNISIRTTDATGGPSRSSDSNSIELREDPYSPYACVAGKDIQKLTKPSAIESSLGKIQSIPMLATLKGIFKAHQIFRSKR